MHLSHLRITLDEFPTKRRLLVSGSDARYFPMLEELLMSIQRFPASRSLTLACVDGGLTGHQVDTLTQQGIVVRRPYIPADMTKKRLTQALKKRPSLAINLAKLWLDQLFADYDTILWLDADCWVQEEDALELLFRAAETPTPALAIIPELFTHKPFRLRWTPFGLAQVRSILYKNARLARLPRNLCRMIGTRPTLNGGVFALTQNAPHWNALRHWQHRVLRYGKPFCSDQLSMALVVYADKLSTEILPIRCNYMGPWLYHTSSSKICEHLYPHLPAGIIHLAGHDAMRIDPEATTTVRDEKGQEHLMSLRFSGLMRLSEHAQDST